jgi:3-deoxy-D-manno-octulosonic acid kinase
MAVVRSDFLSHFERHRLLDFAVFSLRAVSGGSADATSESGGLTGGRGTVRIVQAGPLGEAVVRPYRRGGLVEAFNERRYFLGNRAFDELVATHRLHRRGAPVPEVLAAVQTALRPGYAACIVTRRVPKAISAAAALEHASASRTTAVLEAMGRSVRRLHEAGGVHADLNAHNLLVPEDVDGAVTIIDLDRVGVVSGPAPPRRARANLDRLRRSLRKLGLDPALDRWNDFERAYKSPPRPPTAA